SLICSKEEHSFNEDVNKIHENATRSRRLAPVLPAAGGAIRRRAAKRGVREGGFSETNRVRQGCESFLRILPLERRAAVEASLRDQMKGPSLAPARLACEFHHHMCPGVERRTARD